MKDEMDKTCSTQEGAKTFYSIYYWFINRRFKFPGFYKLKDKRTKSEQWIGKDAEGICSTSVRTVQNLLN
jgi:hypothetical protein